MLGRAEEEYTWCYWLNSSNWQVSRKKILFRGHFLFSHLDRLRCRDLVDRAAPVWINMVRDPVDRFHSQFYYERQFKTRPIKPSEVKEEILEFYCNVKSNTIFWQEYLSKDMDSCVLSGDAECNFRPGSAPDRQTMVTYFCGNSPDCRKVGKAERTCWRTLQLQ